MSQIRDWDGKCQFCGKESEEHTMSTLDTKLICLECSAAEFRHVILKDESEDVNNE